MSILTKKTEILIVTYVNNILIIGKDIIKVKTLKKKLIKIFNIKNLGLAKYFIKVQITKDKKEGIITLY
jgi:hypothetical protein